MLSSPVASGSVAYPSFTACWIRLMAGVVIGVLLGFSCCPGFCSGLRMTEAPCEIGAGLGPFAGKAWRIGLMGHAATWRNVDLLLAALREVMG